MTIKSLKARILRALKSSLAAADSPPPSPTKPGAAIRTDASSDDASFFDARDKEGGHSEEEPLDAWELVDQAAADGIPVDPAPAAPAPADPSDPAEPLLLLGLPSRCPPPGGDSRAVLYTTSLRGVRRTFEDCERAREAVESCAAALGVAGAVDERDVSLHGEYLREVRELAGEGAAPPRLFVMGRYVGGAEEVAALAESGKLREMMRWAKARGEAVAGNGRDSRDCEGCGGARFVPCWECGGSCKVVAAAGDRRHQAVERCGKCNENGLMMCPICHS